MPNEYTMPQELQDALRTLTGTAADAIWDWINDQTAIGAAEEIQRFLESEVCS